MQEDARAGQELRLDLREEELLELDPVQFNTITIWRPAASYNRQVEMPAGLV